MSVLGILSNTNFICVNKLAIKALGGLHEAVILGAFASKQQYNNGQAFYYTYEDIEVDTYISEHQARKAIKKMTDLGVLSSKMIGVPAKKYYLLHEDEILNILCLKNKTSSHSKIEGLEVQNFNDIIYNKNTYNKNTYNNKVKKEQKSDLTTSDEVLHTLLSHYETINKTKSTLAKPTKEGLTKILKEYTIDDVKLVIDYLAVAQATKWHRDNNFNTLSTISKHTKFHEKLDSAKQWRLGHASKSVISTHKQDKKDYTNLDF